ncbi:MAG: MATE family efflux transporter [bacterium]|nr:MATE family efflux transporter [bacterium]
MKKRKVPNLLEGNLTKSIIQLGYPMALGSLAQSLYNLADAFWVGKLGREAISAPGISWFILFLFIAVGLGFSTAGTSLVAQYIGAGEKEKANNTAGTLLVYLTVISTVLSLFGFIFARPLLELLETPPDAFDMTLSYFRIVVAGMPLTFPMFVYQSAMNGYGDTISPLKISLFTAFINLVLDPLLIFGWLGFPALGVEGAAITTVITRALASGIGLYLFFSGKKGIKLTLRHLKPDINLTPLLTKIAIPSCIGFTGSAMGFIVLMGIVNRFGTPVVSAYTIGMRVIHFFMLPAMGVSAAVTAIVGQNLGAGQIVRAKRVVSKGIMLILAIVVPASLLMAVFGKQVIQFFIPGDPLVQEIGRMMFFIAPMSVIFFGWSSVLEGAFQGAGYTMPVMVTHIARLWVFRIPLVYLMAFVIMGGPGNVAAATGIWWGMVLSNAGSVTMMALWYKKGKWAQARIKKEGEKESPMEQGN